MADQTDQEKAEFEAWKAEKAKATPAPTAPKTSEIVQSDNAERRKLEERISKAEKQHQSLTEELTGLREIVRKAGELPPKIDPNAEPKKKNLLEEIEELVFGPKI